MILRGVGGKKQLPALSFLSHFVKRLNSWSQSPKPADGKFLVQGAAISMLG